MKYYAALRYKIIMYTYVTFSLFHSLMYVYICFF